MSYCHQLLYIKYICIGNPRRSRKSALRQWVAPEYMPRGMSAAGKIDSKAIEDVRYRVRTDRYAASVWVRKQIIHRSKLLWLILSWIYDLCASQQKK